MLDGRIMGLDIGDKTIGVAVSDIMGITAQGVKTIRRESKKKDIEELKNIINSKEFNINTDLDILMKKSTERNR